MAGIKWIGSGQMNYKKGLPRASVTVILNDPDTKLPVAVVDGTEISTMRTGASGGIAIKLLAKSDAKVMTICGAGIMDIALATRCYQEALKQGLGTMLPFWE